jgi:hypothetical protein
MLLWSWALIIFYRGVIGAEHPGTIDLSGGIFLV